MKSSKSYAICYNFGFCGKGMKGLEILFYFFFFEIIFISFFFKEQAMNMKSVT